MYCFFITFCGGNDGDGSHLLNIWNEITALTFVKIVNFTHERIIVLVCFWEGTTKSVHKRDLKIYVHLYLLVMDFLKEIAELCAIF